MGSDMRVEVRMTPSVMYFLWGFNAGTSSRMLVMLASSPANTLSTPTFNIIRKNSTAHNGETAAQIEQE